MTWRERRAAGITIRGVLKTARQLHAAGALDGLEADDAAIVVMDGMLADKPQWSRDPKFDFDSLLAWIEKIMPIILQLIAIFGGL